MLARIEKRKTLQEKRLEHSTARCLAHDMRRIVDLTGQQWATSITVDVI